MKVDVLPIVNTVKCLFLFYSWYFLCHFKAQEYTGCVDELKVISAEDVKINR